VDSWSLGLSRRACQLPLHIRYIARARLPFLSGFPVLADLGIGIENPRVAGSIPALGTTDGTPGPLSAFC